VDRLNFEKSGKADLDKLASLSYRVFGMTYGWRQGSETAHGAENEPADALGSPGDPCDLYLPRFHFPNRRQAANRDGY
jgi:hypothetical protein